MQSLFEEFFRKIFKFARETSWLIRVLIKLIIFILIVGFVILVVYSFLRGNYILLLIISGVAIAAEIAHYVRKSRERVMVEKETEKNEKKDNVEEMLKPVNAKNKGLLKGGVKNKGLLKGRK